MTIQPSTWRGEPHPPTPSQRAVPGTVIGGRYTLRVAIGHGGMGTVWQAADALLHRDVAVKEVLLPPGIAEADRTALYERTMREARAAAALSHPSVVQVYDVVTEGGRPWIIMELLHARSLADMIISDGPLAARAVAKIGVALLGALEVAHGAGVLHRDVKPANILICTDGRCVLTDFGVARLATETVLTTPGMVLGSPHFISPERAVGGKFGPPSDLFSLGVSLYTAIEGRPPFDRGDPFETMRAVVEEAPARTVRSGPLAPVLYGLLEKDPDRRWDVPTARAALRDLLAGPLANQAVTHVTDPYTVVPVTPPPAPPPPPMPTGQVGGRALVSPAPTGQVGGRAMLSPDEPLFAHSPSQPTGRQYGRPPEASPLLAATNPGLAQVPEGHHHARHGGRGMLADLGSAARTTAGGLAGRIGRWPKALTVSLAAGVALLLLIGIAAAAGVFGGNTASPARPVAQSTPKGPLIPNPKNYSDHRGFSLNVPSDWKQNTTHTYIDFTDPDDTHRKLRVNVEKAGGTAADFLQSAERQLESDHNKCAAPYKRIGLRGVQLDGRVAAELEYTCGSGTTMRHGIWRATVTGRQAYEFYLSVEFDKFAESSVIYQEAVRSYKLTAG